MKEATQDLNMTMVVVISVGVLLTFFFYFLWPILNANFTVKSQCSEAACDCVNREVVDGVEYCTNCRIDGEPIEDMRCLYKG